MSTIVLDIPDKYTQRFSSQFIEKKIVSNLDSFFFQLELEKDMQESKQSPQSDFYNI